MKENNTIDKIIQIIREHTIVDNGLELKLYDYDVADLLALINSLRGDRMEIFNDIAMLQERWQELIDNDCLTQKAMCDLCIPFRDKYKLKDSQVLQIARKEVNIATINEWLGDSNE